MLKTQQAHLDPAGFGHKLPHFLCVWLFQVCVCSHSSRHDTPSLQVHSLVIKTPQRLNRCQLMRVGHSKFCQLAKYCRLLQDSFCCCFIDIHFRVLSSRCKENSRTVEKAEPKHIKGKIMHALVVDTS